jgi:hypothetical protein
LEHLRRREVVPLTYSYAREEEEAIGHWRKMEQEKQQLLMLAAIEEGSKCSLV